MLLQTSFHNVVNRANAAPSFCNSPLIKISQTDAKSHQMVNSPRFGVGSLQRKNSDSSTNNKEKERRSRSSRINQRNQDGSASSRSPNCSQEQEISSQRGRIIENSVRMSYSRTASLENLVQHSPNKQEILGFARFSAAKKIQRVYRAFLLWKRIKQKASESRGNKQYSKLRKILAAKIIVRNVKKWMLIKEGRAMRKNIIAKVVLIQRMFRQTVKQQKIQFIKKHMLAFYEGWKVRRCITILEQKIKEYVHQDNKQKKAELKLNFHILFDKVIRDKLYIISRYNRYTNQLRKKTEEKPIEQKQQPKTPIKTQAYVVKRQSSQSSISSVKARNKTDQKRVQMVNQIKLNHNGYKSPISNRNSSKHQTPHAHNLSSMTTPAYFNIAQSQDTSRILDTTLGSYCSNPTDKSKDKPRKVIDFKSLKQIDANNISSRQLPLKKNNNPESTDKSVRTPNRPQSTLQNSRDCTNLLQSSRLSKRSSSRIQLPSKQKEQQQQVSNDDAIQMLLKIQEQYKNNFNQMEMMLDNLVKEQIQTLQQQQQTEGSKPKRLIGQTTKDNMKYNRLHSDIKDSYYKVSHFKHTNN